VFARRGGAVSPPRFTFATAPSHRLCLDEVFYRPANTNPGEEPEDA
jgi:hypothetical protein